MDQIWIDVQSVKFDPRTPLQYRVCQIIRGNSSYVGYLELLSSYTGYLEFCGVPRIILEFCGVPRVTLELCGVPRIMLELCGVPRIMLELCRVPRIMPDTSDYAGVIPFIDMWCFTTFYVFPPNNIPLVSFGKKYWRQKKLT